MQQFTIQAGSAGEAFEKMKREHGEDAVILSHRSVRVGGLFGLFARRGVEITGYSKRTKRALPLAAVQPVEASAPSADPQERKQEVLDAILRYSGKTREQIRPPKEDVSSEILREIKDLKAEMNRREGAPVVDAPSIQEIERRLRRNEFTEDYIGQITQRIRSSFSLEELEDAEAVERAVVEWIGEDIDIAPPLSFDPKNTRTFIIVGPTGVGKTTTVAKLSARYGLGAGAGAARARNVRIVTIDSYRIGAREQIETYAEIMQIPVSCVETVEDLKKVVDLYRGVDLILVDTIGRSPKDSVSLAKMKKIIEACGLESETHLAVSATTKANDLAELLRQFEPFGYSSVILTKLDETSFIGNVISVLKEKGKALSYLATGQRVPQDIERASRARLLRNLDGFAVEREVLAKDSAEDWR